MEKQAHAKINPLFPALLISAFYFLLSALPSEGEVES
jgi:hypothetical protein